MNFSEAAFKPCQSKTLLCEKLQWNLSERILDQRHAANFSSLLFPQAHDCTKWTAGAPVAAAPSYQGLGITTVWHLSAASRRGDYSVLTSKEVCLTWVWRCAGRASPWSSRAVLISPPQTLSVFLQQHNWLPVTLTHECMALRGQNVHTDKHRFTFSRMKAHIHKGRTQHGSSSLSLSLSFPWY